MKGLHTDDVSDPILIVVTVNDYLAQRDAEWMGRVHRFLGLSVGLIQVIYDIELKLLHRLELMKEMMPVNVNYVVFSSFALLACAERNET